MKTYLAKFLAVLGVIMGLFSRASQGVSLKVNTACVRVQDFSREGWDYMYSLSWVRKSWQGQRGAVGAGAITGLFITGMMAFILYIVIANFWPSAQDANTAVQAATETDAGTTTSKIFFNIGLWLMVVGVFVALFVMLIRNVGGSGGGGRRRR